MAPLDFPVHYNSFDDYPVYNGQDLEVTYSPEKTIFKIWSPDIDDAIVRLYEEGEGGTAFHTQQMKKAKDGTWSATVTGDIRNKFYTFQVKFEEQWLEETAGSYAKAVGVNGKRGA
ncbi:MAG: type I pullulanase, partial [Paludibacteraceae bacterium]|nr:type I pullulanase [Paludibacteraceae bacterium]